MSKKITKYRKTGKNKKNILRLECKQIESFQMYENF